jgi:glucose/arabinose dehydrogenase
VVKERGLLVAAIAILAYACDSGVTDPVPLPTDFQLRAVEVVDGLSDPVHLTAPEGDSRLFIVEQIGRIRIFENGQLLQQPFLDIRSRVVAGGEQGLLSMAFHPRYDSNGFFYVNFTGSGGATRVERFRVSADRNRADPQSSQLVLTVAQPFTNHNGGLVKFGPDGMLYIGMGDGGSGGDPLGHGQDPNTLLGDLLRIDVDGDAPYEVPGDNPFVGRANHRPEIWATGLRNPWRFSFDEPTNRLYLADVGQNRFEEINVVPADDAGLNFGWNIMEASACFSPSSGCNTAGLVLPAHEYSQGPRCSVTGGYVYRGGAMPELQGTYFYSDYCEGIIRSFRVQADGSVGEHREWAFGSLGNVSSFGVDGSHELYVVTLGGTIYRLEEDLD